MTSFPGSGVRGTTSPKSHGGHRLPVRDGITLPSARRPFVGEWVAPDHGVAAELRGDGRFLLRGEADRSGRLRPSRNRLVPCLAGFYAVLRAEELEVRGLEWYMCVTPDLEHPLSDQRNSRPESRYRFHVTDNGNRLILREPQEVLEVLRRFHSIPPREEPLEFVRRG